MKMKRFLKKLIDSFSENQYSFRPVFCKRGSGVLCSTVKTHAFFEKAKHPRELLCEAPLKINLTTVIYPDLQDLS